MDSKTHYDFEGDPKGVWGLLVRKRYHHSLSSHSESKIINNNKINNNKIINNNNKIINNNIPKEEYSIDPPSGSVSVSEWRNDEILVAVNISFKDENKEKRNFWSWVRDCCDQPPDSSSIPTSKICLLKVQLAVRDAIVSAERILGANCSICGIWRTVKNADECSTDPDNSSIIWKLFLKVLFYFSVQIKEVKEINDQIKVEDEKNNSSLSTSFIVAGFLSYANCLIITHNFKLDGCLDDTLKDNLKIEESIGTGPEAIGSLFLHRKKSLNSKIIHAVVSMNRKCRILVHVSRESFQFANLFIIAQKLRQGLSLQFKDDILKIKKENGKNEFVNLKNRVLQKSKSSIFRSSGHHPDQFIVHRNGLRTVWINLVPKNDPSSTTPIFTLTLDFRSYVRSVVPVLSSNATWSEIIQDVETDTLRSLCLSSYDAFSMAALFLNDRNKIKNLNSSGVLRLGMIQPRQCPTLNKKVSEIIYFKPNIDSEIHIPILSSDSSQSCDIINSDEEPDFYKEENKKNENNDVSDSTTTACKPKKRSATQLLVDYIVHCKIFEEFHSLTIYKKLGLILGMFLFSTSLMAISMQRGREVPVMGD